MHREKLKNTKLAKRHPVPGVSLELMQPITRTKDGARSQMYNDLHFIS